jgi:hypothetical protein
LETWAGITLAYYNKAPVSFFIAAISFALYLLARYGSRLLPDRQRRVVPVAVQPNRA